MFPIPWNFPFRKKNGDMSTIGAEIGGAGSELPPHSSSDAGKLLGVKANGSLEWSDTVNSEIQTLTNNLSDEVETRAELGAHNLLPNDITTQTISGVTFTKNADGSVSLSGTASEDIYYNLNDTVGNTNNGWVELEVGKTYIFSGGDNEDAYGKPTLSLYLSRVNGTNTWINSYESVSNRTISITSNTKIVATIYIKSDTDTSGYTFKPMIRLASDPSTEYTPYAMTNRELTEILSDVGTYNVPVIMSSARNNYVRGAIIYHDKTAKHTVAINEVKQFADSTDYTSQFSVDYSNAGFAIIYSTTVALAGALMNVDVTIS